MLIAHSAVGKGLELPVVSGHVGNSQTQAEGEVGFIIAVQHLGGRVRMMCNAAGLGISRKGRVRDMATGWRKGTQVLELRVAYDRQGTIVNEDEVTEVMAIAVHAHEQLDEGDTLVTMVRIDGFHDDGSPRAHRSVFFIDATDAWLYDPQSLLGAEHTRSHVEVLAPLLGNLLRHTAVRFTFSRGQADLARQGQTASDCALCNGLCLVAVIAVAFCGIHGAPSVLRCLQCIRAEGLLEVVRFGIPQVWLDRA